MSARPDVVARLKHNYQLIQQEKYGVFMQVFLAVVLLKPTKKEEEEGGVLKVVVDPTVVVAVDLSSAKVKALRSVPEQYQDLDSRLEVRVLQFHV